MQNLYIKKVNIENYKCFKGKFTLKLNSGLNILVGDNETGKSTILEAIHLALTGLLNGRYLKNEITQHLFNKETVSEFVKNVKSGIDLPFILIELFIGGADFALFEGNGNEEKKIECCISLKILFDEKYKSEYAELISNGEIKDVPIEYYTYEWSSCARKPITSSKNIPIKSVLIDSSNYRYQNGSDICISHIERNHLNPQDIVGISQTYRKMEEYFLDQDVIKNINEKIKNATNISKKEIKLTADLASKNAWENSLTTYLNGVPFHQIGKGEQCIVKTKLALNNKKSQNSNLILLEEPENHLSHTKLNQLISDIKENCEEKQIIITTHSSFVANKLGLKNLILLRGSKTFSLDNLSQSTYDFFGKIPGYDTLRLILCDKAILVEGDSDELIIQKAYQIKNKAKKLPIENGTDVISVGTSFLRFLEIAEMIEQPVAVVTDNDGDIVALEKKYANFIGTNSKSFIKICYDKNVDKGTIASFNYNTLEPKILKENNLQTINKILGKEYKTNDELLNYMKENKTECALKIFDTKETIIFPQYIMSSLD